MQIPDPEPGIFMGIRVSGKEELRSFLKRHRETLEKVIHWDFLTESPTKDLLLLLFNESDFPKQQDHNTATEVLQKENMTPQIALVYKNVDVDPSEDVEGFYIYFYAD